MDSAAAIDLARTFDLVNNLIKKIGVAGVEKINSGEFNLIEKGNSTWTESEGVIRFSVIPNGMTGWEWIEFLEDNGRRISPAARRILTSENFLPLAEVGMKKEIIVLKWSIFKDDKRKIRNVLKEAENRGLQKTSPEVACLARYKFTDKQIEEMGLYRMVFMHKPIKDPKNKEKLLLSADRKGVGSLLSAYDELPAFGIEQGVGFAFELPTVN